MGWTFTRRHDGESTTDFFCREFGDGRGGGYGVVDTAVAPGGIVFIALRIAPMEGVEIAHAGRVILFGCYTRRRTSEPQFNFGWKDANASNFPPVCPVRLLDLCDVAAFTDEPALVAWIARCREYHVEAAAKRKAHAKLRPGDALLFENEVGNAQWGYHKTWFYYGPGYGLPHLVGLTPYDRIPAAYECVRIPQSKLRQAAVVSTTSPAHAGLVAAATSYRNEEP